MTIEVDLAVIGSGGAAFAAAIRASGLGKTVAMVERGTLGGTCVNVGCVPSKALLAAAEARHVALDSGRFPGIRTFSDPVDMTALREATQDLVDGLRAQKYRDVADDYGWEWIEGDASFSGSVSEPSLLVTAKDGSVKQVIAEHYLIATGADPVIPSIAGIDTVDYLTSATVMQLGRVPESLIVIGGGYVAMEQAQLFARLGSRVTMLVRSRLASHEDVEASEVLAEILSDEGIEVILGARVNSVASLAGVVKVAVETSEKVREVHAAHLLVGTGRLPVTSGLNLDRVGVKTRDGGAVLVNEGLATSNPRIWAAGDVTAHHEFVYVAASHGVIAVDNAFSDASLTVDYRHLPRVTFTSPALAAVGLTEQQAGIAGIETEVRVLPLSYVPRAIVNRDTRGFIKVVATADSRRILGISAVAKDAGELAAAGVYILEGGLTVDDVANTWAPYLTMAEGIKLTCQTYTRNVEQLSCCAT